METKFNRNVIIAIVILVGTIIWGFESLRTRSYSGTDLNFSVGTGIVTMTNPSDSALPVQLIATNTSVFSVTSSIDELAGRSTTQGTGSNRTQRYEFMLPSGVSDFTVTRSANVSFVASTTTLLEASVQPLSAGDSRATLVLAAILIAGSLFYLSYANDHQWLSAARRSKATEQAASQEADIQNFKRMFKPRSTGSVQSSQEK